MLGCYLSKNKLKGITLQNCNKGILWRPKKFHINVQDRENIKYSVLILVKIHFGNHQGMSSSILFNCVFLKPTSLADRRIVQSKDKNRSFSYSLTKRYFDVFVNTEVNYLFNSWGNVVDKLVTIVEDKDIEHNSWHIL